MANFIKNLIIETTSFCNLRCKMCPTLAYESIKGTMSEETFNNIVPYLKYIQNVDLTGWGEPLLDQDLFQRIKICKKHNCGVTFTTNGTLLNKKNIKQLLKSGLDGLHISFDGGTSKTYESIRRGANFNQVIHNIKYLSKVKPNKFSLSIAFVLMKENSEELVSFLNLMSRFKVDSIDLKNLDVLSKKEDLQNTLLFSDSTKIKQIISKYQSILQQNGIKLIDWDQCLKEIENDCGAYIQDTVFISWRGDVSPCCNLGHPVPRMKENERLENTLKIYGNVNQEDLFQIWNKGEYLAFRSAIMHGDVPKECSDCNLIKTKQLMTKYDLLVDLENKNSPLTKIANLVGQNKEVLEFGCSTGYLSQVLKEKGCQVTGIEINEKAAQIARQHCPKVIIGDIERLDYQKELGKERFDIMIFADVLEHLRNPRSVLIKVKKFLKSDGKLLISIPNIAHASVRLELLTGDFEYEDLGILDNTHLKYFTKKSILRLLDSCGYYIEDIDAVSKGLSKQTIQKFLTKINLEREENLVKVLNQPEALAYQYVVVASLEKPANYSMIGVLSKPIKAKNDTELQIRKLKEEIQRIYNSRGWKIISFLNRTRKSIPFLKKL